VNHQGKPIQTVPDSEEDIQNLVIVLLAFLMSVSTATAAYL